MSLEGVTDAVARVVLTAPNIVAAYASTASDQDDDVQPIPQDIPGAPVGKGVAVVRHDHFELTHTGKPELLQHFITVEIWVSATSAASAEKSLLPLATEIIEAFRGHVGLYGQAHQAKLTAGGPPEDQTVNGKPYQVYPLTVLATELTVNTYALGPAA